jgi:hypothetical protein
LDNVSSGNAVDGGGRLQPGVEGLPPEISEGTGTSASAVGLHRRVVGAASWTFAGAVFGRAISLAGTIVATRLLTPTAFGQFSAIQLMVTTFAGFAALGLGVAVTKRIAEFRATDPERVGDFARVATRVVLLSGTAATAVVIAGRGWLASSWLHSPELATGLALASAMALTSSLFGVQVGILTGFEAFKPAAVEHDPKYAHRLLLLLGTGGGETPALRDPSPAEADRYGLGGFRACQGTDRPVRPRSTDTVTHLAPGVPMEVGMPLWSWASPSCWRSWWVNGCWQDNPMGSSMWLSSASPSAGAWSSSSFRPLSRQ